MAATKKRTRSKWTAPLAQAIGWEREKLRRFFISKGYPSPFDSELRGMQLLEDAGVSLAKYKPMFDGVPLEE